jgi:hypothetical protein
MKYCVIANTKKTWINAGTDAGAKRKASSLFRDDGHILLTLYLRFPSGLQHAHTTWVKDAKGWREVL